MISLLSGAVLLLATSIGSWQPVSAAGWGAIVYIGLFELGITFLIWLQALRISESTAHVSQIIYLAPFLALVWIRLILSEKILPSTIAGLALIITGLLVQSRKRNGNTENLAL